MKIKEILITTFITLIVLGLFALNYIGNKFVLRANSIYAIYLDGGILGYIDDDQELYDLINDKQKAIRKKYDVANVYPPSNFQIIKTNSYDVTLSSTEEIYNKIAKMEPFTIEGYTINVTPSDETKEPFNIYVIDREIFDSSMKNFVLAFIDQDTYQSYIDNTQPVIETTGKIIESMYFDEAITIKKSYISVDNKIYTNTDDLSRYLLFGDNNSKLTYTVQEGDTIASVSDSHKLNVSEFLVANPQYSSVDSLLKIGDKVDVTLINPIITYVNEINEVADVEVPYEKKIVYDETKSYTYSETTPGVTGLNRINQIYQIKNGEMQSSVYIASNIELIPKVDEVTTKGGKEFIYGGSGGYIDTGSTWGWPTNTPYVITSVMGWRWGAMHTGIDISGTGFGSPIYAALDGVVTSATWEGKCGAGAGYCVFIEHPNGYCSIYAHMAYGSFAVSVGDHVSRGQIIGGMGATGYATGVHLHFEVWNGYPYSAGAQLVNPFSLYG